jgi:RNA polymerase sigma-70 factor (ECF subfamily)
MTVMDSQWLELCRDGDTGAIEKMVNTHQAGIYRLAYSILDDSHEAEDVVQETFLAALRALDSFQEKASFSTWLASIAINLSRTRLRRRQMRVRLTAVLQNLWHWHQTESPSLEQNAIQNENCSKIWRAIHSLDEKQRLPVILRYYHDYPVAEIAALLHIPEGTVHSRLNKARETLRQVLEEGQS